MPLRHKEAPSARKAFLFMFCCVYKAPFVRAFFSEKAEFFDSYGIMD
ncbi:hypothetical protein HMPREF0080_01213 [Anaeroglobus geminatus F0357]|uniref:Uncharacterized protein n=1 Tax=Anaeroglobus geminatus F0357 TaxID=861450 RepID=G9YHS9_9FIRM|nr:hypothetical protein HMPREF0080_01213 [Anaeroglobus geminatus F0357]